ncbi:MAG: 8-oxo-dGTP diphosphatase [Christensenellaceae bacterium]|jgi:8-oxo-dGTP pyrophosphatase MutT (NUDIX family)|nr:8-oxo-dGTP diphosphatase [Christensenellaceae bacterium]
MVDTTLTLIIKNNQILLGEKKRKIGKGLLNGCGGKVEQGEDIEQAMIRETHEEWGIVPLDYRKCAMIQCEHDKAELSQRLHIFRAFNFEGSLIGTSEISMGQWFDLDKIPFDRMFPGDREWMPLVLNNNFVIGKVHFDVDFNIVRQNYIIRKRLTHLRADCFGDTMVSSYGKEL